MNRLNFDLSGIAFSRHDKRIGITMPLKLTELLAEDIGFHLGDGHMNIVKYSDGNRYQFCYCGNSVNDKEYYFTRLISRKKELFGLKTLTPRFYLRDNTIKLNFNSKALIHFFNIIFDIPLGLKSGVKVPSIIKNADRKIKIAFIRGLADADFTLSFKRKHKKVKYYPTIKFDTFSKNLYKDVKQILIELGFTFTSAKGGYFDERTKKYYTTYWIDLNGKKRLEKWMDLIGFSNPYFLKRYQEWKRMGYIRG